ncbi:MAG: di-trans,poly-cis-decaprenylcistransferase [Actinobacteria bacterium]|nr:di-trans,poly-cis-decaprenylcistransferase [Actinomycetota bacterium]
MAISGLLRRVRGARALSRARGGAQGNEGALVGVPRSVAIIMDGNGRWADERRLPVAAGHRAGAQALKRVVRHAPDIGIEQLAVFSFSTENWGRPAREVDDLMDLFCELIDREVPELNAERVQLRFIGRRAQLSPELRQRISAGEAATRHNTRLTLFVAMNYGGRAEIVDAARAAMDAHGTIDEERLSENLYAPDLRDPELVIRTSGEQRLSNFMLWQTAYAELVFSPKLWPEFTPDDLDAALHEYTVRTRRFGRRSA